MNPVRAGMVASAADYLWLSHAFNVYAAPSPLPRPHPTYLHLGRDSEARCQRYREIFGQSPASEELDAIRLHLKRQHALGSERFRAAIEAQLNRRAGPARVGRPRKVPLSLQEVHSDPCFGRPLFWSSTAG